MSETPEIPQIILMSNYLFEYLQQVISVPEMLDGPAVIKKASLIRSIMEAVPADQYNLAILNQLLAIQEQQRQAQVVVPEVTPGPVAANRAENFVPHRLLQAQAEEASAPKLVTKTAPSKSAPINKKKTSTKVSAAKSKSKSKPKQPALSSTSIKKKHSW